MKIGFDARMLNETGVGRYIRNILPLLIQSNSKNSWVIYVQKQNENQLKKLISQRSNVKIITFNPRWHSFSEQILLPFKIYKEKLDIFHTPYINVPVFYFKKKVVTIHDLTVLDVATGRASTRNLLFYYIKRLGYKIALRSALRSKVIFVVTNSVKQDIIKHFPKINPSKIVVTYNGFSRLQFRVNKKISKLLKILNKK